MAIIISEVTTPRDLRQFIALPAKIHKNHKEWVPTLLNDDKVTFTPKLNETYKFCSTIRLLARRDNRVVGRIMGIVHHQYNEMSNDQSARFGFMETYEDIEVFTALIEAIEEWAKKLGCKKLVGPMGFSDRDPQGFLVEGFDQHTMYMTNCSLPYMNQFINQLGFSPQDYYHEYKLTLTDQMMDRLSPFAERAARNPDFKLKTYTHTRQIKPDIRPVFELINRTYKSIYGFAPLTMREADEFAYRYVPLLNPKLIKTVTDRQNKIIAFIVAMPDFSEGVKKARGRIFPFGWIPILHSMHTSDKVVLFLGGIDEEYRHKGIDALMADDLLKNSRALGYRYLDSHLIMEKNIKMRRELERLDGAVLYKRYCIYQKGI